jgi:hypothetical protein
VYKGLDIVTNKVSSGEMAEVPHHLIDILSPLDQFNIVDYRNLALAKVSHSVSARTKRRRARFFHTVCHCRSISLYLESRLQHTHVSIVFICFVRSLKGQF